MSNGARQDSNFVSVGSWMLLMLVTAIPVIGWILILVLAFAGENQTRKNYFRAILAWVLLFLCLCLALGLLGVLPAMLNSAKSWPQKQ